MIFSHRNTSLLLPAITGLALRQLSVSVQALSVTTKAGLSIQTPSVTNKSVPGLKNGMDYVTLGSSDLVVPKVCMGTMTFGEVRP